MTVKNSQELLGNNFYVELSNELNRNDYSLIIEIQADYSRKGYQTGFIVKTEIVSKQLHGPFNTKGYNLVFEGNEGKRKISHQGWTVIEVGETTTGSPCIKEVEAYEQRQYFPTKENLIACIGLDDYIDTTILQLTELIQLDEVKGRLATALQNKLNGKEAISEEVLTCFELLLKTLNSEEFKASTFEAIQKYKQLCE